MSNGSIDRSVGLHDPIVDWNRSFLKIWKCLFLTPEHLVHRIYIPTTTHGANYTSDPASVDVCYAGTIEGDRCLLQNGSFSTVSLLARGANYIGGDLCLMSTDGTYNQKIDPWRASFTTMSNGSIQNLTLNFQGVGYFSDPSSVELCYKVIFLLTGKFSKVVMQNSPRI